mmetsp:Transcript_8554/g.20758  ORF Transcript_8554/g.20758 Transcript_8554/m.20758 type:complete len:210 (+) Transcript_8554:829-1458(+)
MVFSTATALRSAASSSQRKCPCCARRSPRLAPAAFSSAGESGSISHSHSAPRGQSGLTHPRARTVCRTAGLCFGTTFFSRSCGRAISDQPHSRQNLRCSPQRSRPHAAPLSSPRPRLALHRTQTRPRSRQSRKRLQMRCPARASCHSCLHPHSETRSLLRSPAAASVPFFRRTFCTLLPRRFAPAPSSVCTRCTLLLRTEFSPCPAPEP